MSGDASFSMTVDDIVWVQGEVRKELIDAIAAQNREIDARNSEVMRFLADHDRFSSLDSELAALKAYSSALPTREINRAETAAFHKVLQWLTDAKTVDAWADQRFQIRDNLEARRADAARDWLRSTSEQGQNEVRQSPDVLRLSLAVPHSLWESAVQHLPVGETSVSLPPRGNRYPTGITVTPTLSNSDGDAGVAEERTAIIHDICEPFETENEEGLEEKLDSYLKQIGEAERLLIQRAIPSTQHVGKSETGVDDRGETVQLRAARAVNKSIREIFDRSQAKWPGFEGLAGRESMDTHLTGLEHILWRTFRDEEAEHEFYANQADEGASDAGDHMEVDE
ncbi:uncharacterized protein MKK02DRAFT_45085 [Dioszegia hungarica]|uniref:Uncharacterized protein n=1 Tax=Dioszegia hungarica TaxID=4972 RepID=A0AA38H8A9_9TREE|nr:uncharacterized protein MKK02DRAFT_45085 [Dioszegia hungarica]KAI9636377.1 hypothetical protein MKK02DRAFT_45085 [Dioszegia hungarica]